jgi:Protein of unknown function (DUF2894)
MSDQASELGDTIAAMRACGAHRADPVRFSFIEALARRGARHTGAARAVLEARLAEVVADYIARQRTAGGAAAGMAPVARAPGRPVGPIAGLVARLNGGAADDTAGSELKAMRTMGRTWARLSADRQLTQSRASLPAQTGPLNSHRLVLQALQQMQALSPEYLQHFIAHVDGLRALALADHPPGREPADRSSGVPPRRKAGRARG